jgi:putative ABC transport system permease protein
MIRNYFKVIVRNMLRNKAYSIINILGLSAGLAMYIIILQYVHYEESYDRFHAHSDDIYRVAMHFSRPGQEAFTDAATYVPAGAALKADFPEVQAYTFVTPEYGRIVFQVDDRIFEEEKIYYADSTFFHFFDFKLLAGDPTTMLKEPASIVLSRRVAEKYFGPMEQWKESPLNKTIRVNGATVMRVTGIMENVPASSHFKPSVLISYAEFTAGRDLTHNWGWNDFYTYIRLAPGTDYHLLQAKLGNAYVEKYMGKDSHKSFVLQPLTSIHLTSRVGFELEPAGDARAVQFLVIISIMILVIAWVNYINLSTARGESRGKEVGVRKVNGATRREIMGQFLLESFCMNLIGIVLAMIIVQASVPLIGAMLEKDLQFTLVGDQGFLRSLLLLYVIGSVGAGIYPAFALSSFQPLRVLKASAASVTRGKSWLRQALVVFQFVMSAGLITGTIIVINQLQFMRTADLGFSFSNTLIINSPSTIANDSIFFSRYQDFKQRMLKYPAVQHVTLSSAVPGKSYNDLDNMASIRILGRNDQNLALLTYRVDEDFLDVYGMKLLSGRKFPPTKPGTDSLVYLNQKAVELFGFTSADAAVGQKIDFQGRTVEVLGVVENYHHKSLRNVFEPMMIRNTPAYPLYISLRLDANSASMHDVMARVREQWQQTYADNPFNYSFLDTHVSNQYKEDERFGRVFTLFSFFSIAISCLGLLGLVSYTVTVRMKEVGVRKVLGATASSIFLLFSRDYVRLLLVANVIGIPLAYYVLTLWLEDFAYRASLAWWMFLLPIGVVALLAITAVGSQILKAAQMNPVNTLRQE